MDGTQGATERVVRTAAMPWIPTGPGKAFRPLRFGTDGWLEIMRLEPGARVTLHRHNGSVDALTLAGSRRLLDGRTVGVGDYVHEPAGTIDAWEATGDEPCLVVLAISGAVEYLDADGRVTGRVDSASQRALYRDACRAQGRTPEAVGDDAMEVQEA